MPKKESTAKKTKKWSGKVTKESHALSLEDKVFTKAPREIAASLKKSSEQSDVRKLEQAKDELRRLFGRDT